MPFAAGRAVLNPGSRHLALIKPRAVLPQVFCAVAGMLLAVPRLPPWRALLFGTAGIWLALAAATALNPLIERHIDCRGARAAQPVSAANARGDRQTLVFALLLAAASMLVLALWVNRLTAVLALAGIIGYSALYTAFIQRAAPQNIVMEGFAGAVVPLLGWAAVTNMQAPRDWAYALLLTLIVFTWAPPHLGSLALMRRGDCRRIGAPVPPAVPGAERTRVEILFYTILLMLASFFPYVTGMAGALYLGGAVALGLGHLYCALRLMRPPGERFAPRAFGYSTLYLYALFALLVVDHWLGRPSIGAGNYVYRLIG